MPVIHHQSVLKGLTVQEAMRRSLIQLPRQASLEQAIRYLIKYKVNALLIINEQHEPLGVVSKTDLMGAYYAGLPVDAPVETIMVGPPLFCHPEDSLDAALETMRTHRVHRLYVLNEAAQQAMGVLAYPDIVGLLYRFCNKCNRSISKNQDLADRFQVREVMTPAVQAYGQDASLAEVMEGLAAYRFGAVLIKNLRDLPVGVVSKTDLIIAYKHGVSPQAEARTIMNSPVQSCDQEDLLLAALQKMIFADVHRLFVYQGQPQHLVGVLSLSDVARFRSGSCRACLISRVKID
ncbi:MAG: CBS domain-containing protein [Desulfobacca sp.]|nr:CBS domain-containing protein [Desulfobacca sp.]